MSMNFYIKLYLLTIPVFFLIDMLWLGLMAKSFYREQLSAFLGQAFNWPAAVLFYLMFIVGILLFAVIPALNKNSLQHALIWGALFGFFTYATYDLTNLATLPGWPIKVVIVDILWGTFLCASVAATSYAIGRWLQ